MKLVDQDTGEVFLHLAVAFKKRYPKQVQEDGFMTMFKIGWDYLSTIDDLTGRDFRVLMALLSSINFKNWISISQQTIAEKLNLKQPDVAKSLKKLLEYQILERQRDPADHRRWMYRFNPTLGWMGDAEDWKKYMQERANEKVVPLVRTKEDS
jgi:DNA-binding MarR family transcriptional regulator